MKKIAYIFILTFIFITMASCLSTSGSRVTVDTIDSRRHVVTSTYTDLGKAINTYNNEEVQRLLNSGVSPNEKQGGIPPLAVAIQANNLEAFYMILNHKNFSGVNEFYTVSLGGSYPTVETYTAIVDAIHLGHPEMMKALLDKGATVDYLYETIIYAERTLMGSQQTPLIIAMATFGDYELDKGYSTTPFDVEEQYTQIQRIADKTSNINRIMIEHLAHHIAPGNKPYPTDYDYPSYPKSLFMILKEYNKYFKGNPNNVYINKVLFSIADRVNLSYNYATMTTDALSMMKAAGLDAAHMKVLQEAYDYSFVYNTWILNNAPLLEHVLNKGGSVSIKGDGGKHFFTQIYDEDTLNVMLKRGLDINGQTYNGYRLIYSAVKIDLDFLEAVLKNGADPNAESNGLTAADFASGLSFSQKSKVLSLLKQYGGK